MINEPSLDLRNNIATMPTAACKDDGFNRIRGFVSFTLAINDDEKGALRRVDGYLVLTETSKYLSFIKNNVTSLPLTPMHSIG